jgi:conjugal transfer pilus assembly protein TraV
MMKKQLLVLCVVSVSVLFAGCSTSPNYACGSPAGGKCQSVKESYLAALGKKLSAGGSSSSSSSSSNGKPVEATSRVTQYVPEGVAIRSMPQVMRVWVAPWEDANGVFHDQQYSYFVADPGQWTLKANTEKTIYGAGYPVLESPTDKTPAKDDKKPSKPEMTMMQAEQAAIDLTTGN